MNFFKRFLGSQAQPQTGSDSVSSVLIDELRQNIEDNLKLLRHLVTHQPFTQEHMATYLDMCDQMGKSFSPEQRYNMLNADTLLLPERQSDGTFLNGLERMRYQIMQVHLEAISTFIRLLKELPAEPASVRAVQTVIEELDRLAPYIK